jgi:hypothetical protein
LHELLPLTSPRADPGTAINQTDAISIITGAVFNVDIFCQAWHDTPTATRHFFLI